MKKVVSHPVQRRKKSKDVIVEINLTADKRADENVYIYSEAEMTHTDNVFEIKTSHRNLEDNSEYGVFYLKVTDEKKLSLVINYMMPLYLENDGMSFSVTHNLVSTILESSTVQSVCLSIRNRLTDKGGELEALYNLSKEYNPVSRRRLHVSVKEKLRR